MMCPGNPPAPPGYAIWRGPVPPELAQQAVALRNQISTFPFGQQWAAGWNGSTVLFRKDHHTWTFRKTGLQTNICISGITLYSSIPKSVGDYVFDPATAQPDPELALYGARDESIWKPALAIGGGFVGTLVVGTVILRSARKKPRARK